MMWVAVPKKTKKGERWEIRCPLCQQPLLSAGSNRFECISSKCRLRTVRVVLQFSDDTYYSDKESSDSSNKTGAAK